MQADNGSKQANDTIMTIPNPLDPCPIRGNLILCDVSIACCMLPSIGLTISVDKMSKVSEKQSAPSGDGMMMAEAMLITWPTARTRKHFDVINFILLR